MNCRGRSSVCASRFTANSDRDCSKAHTRSVWRNELSKAELRFERQRPLPVRYKEVQLDCGYRLDFVVEDALILELKAVSDFHPIHEAQLLTYLKLDSKSLGLLINFNVPVLKDGVKRVVYGDLFRSAATQR